MLVPCSFRAARTVRRPTRAGHDRPVLARLRPAQRGLGARPNRWEVVVDALRPPVAASVLAVLRSRPRSSAVAPTGDAAAATGIQRTVTPTASRRPGGRNMTTGGHGGSFPSGHTLAVVVCLGLGVHLILPGAPLWAWLTGCAAGAGMGVGLVAIGAHWGDRRPGRAASGTGCASRRHGHGWPTAWGARDTPICSASPAPAQHGGAPVAQVVTEESVTWNRPTLPRYRSRRQGNRRQRGVRRGEGRLGDPAVGLGLSPERRPSSSQTSVPSRREGSPVW